MATKPRSTRSSRGRGGTAEEITGGTAFSMGAGACRADRGVCEQGRAHGHDGKALGQGDALEVHHSCLHCCKALHAADLASPRSNGLACGSRSEPQQLSAIVATRACALGHS